MRKKRFKEIWYHILFWTVYLVLWSARDLVYYPHMLENLLTNIVFSMTVVPFIYFNLYVLIPRYLLQKKWKTYGLLFATGFTFSFFLRHYTVQFFFRQILKVDGVADMFNQASGYVIIVSENMIVVMIAMAMYMIREWYSKERYTRELEKKNIESELSLLKSQLQPHFLFNNLNTIYFLMETNPDLAKQVMLQFSEVLSHQLYNAQKDKVPLSEELDSLESFLKLQSIRHQDFLTLTYHFPDEHNELQIAPMILITFIENAFKHSQKEEGYFIDIQILLKADELKLQVTNSLGIASNTEKGGIGLENVQRRLTLIYPNTHALSITESSDQYQVDLTLKLEKYEKA